MLLRARCETNTPEVGAKALVHEAPSVLGCRCPVCPAVGDGFVYFEKDKAGLNINIM